MSAPRAATTPPGRRAVAVAGLALAAIWLVGAFAQSLAGHLGAPTPAGLHRLVWFGHFQMFTELRPTHARVVAHVEAADGSIEALDLEALFPMDWRAGPGYQRGAFLRDPARLGQLADALCARRVGGGAGAITIAREVWPKRLGQADQRPLAPPDRAVLLERPCAPARR